MIMVAMIRYQKEGHIIKVTFAHFFFLSLPVCPPCC